MLVPIEKSRRLKRRDRQALRVEELSDEEVEAMGRAEMAAEHGYLDAELER